MLLCHKTGIDYNMLMFIKITYTIVKDKLNLVAYVSDKIHVSCAVSASFVSYDKEEHIS